MRRMMSSLSALFILTLPNLVSAQCSGTDLRDSLRPIEQTTLDRYTDGMPYTQGNHWQAQRGGEILNIIGTLHIADPRMDAIVERLDDVIAQSDLLLLEATTEQAQSFEATIAANPALILNPAGALSDHVAPDIWPIIIDRLETMGVPPQSTARLAPWYVALMMGLPDCLLVSTQASSGLDKRLEAVATQENIPSASLEPPETVFKIFSSLQYAEQIQMLEMTALQRGDIDDQTATVIATYFEEDSMQGWMLGKVIVERTSTLPTDELHHLFDRSTEIVLTQRNHTWIPVILDALTNTNGPVALAVGAAHLGGAEGVLQLLENEGFTLTRQPF